MERPYALRVSYEGKTYDVHNYSIPNFAEGLIELPTGGTISVCDVDNIILYPETFEKILNGIDNTKKTKTVKAED